MPSRFVLMENGNEKDHILLKDGRPFPSAFFFVGGGGNGNIFLGFFSSF